MKRFLFGLLVASGLCFVGCEKSMEAEKQDVRDAQKAAADKVKEEQRDVQDAITDGSKKITDEARELEDKKVRDGVIPPTTNP